MEGGPSELGVPPSNCTLLNVQQFNVQWGYSAVRVSPKQSNYFYIQTKHMSSEKTERVDRPIARCEKKQKV